MRLLPGPDYFRDNVFMRNDTIFGACRSLGQDLGFNPMFVRVPLAAGIMFAPLWMIGIYLSLCVLVFAIRTLFPDTVQQTAAVDAAPAEPVAENETVELPRAA